ncbi:MAG: PocR ligand-binding domain-containing protein [Eubacteriales bacterium]|nr:PocR ligand-binding domain-containing protein [Eubacteriales bacterium]
MLNRDRLRELLGYLYDVKRIQCSLHSLDGTENFSSNARSAYCDMICGAPGGYARCLASDQHAIYQAGLKRAPFHYRCHAGAIDAAIPVIIGGETSTVILFGQILDDSPIDRQWENARKSVDWHPDPAGLHSAFRKLPRLSQREIKGCYELVNACVSETLMEQLRAVGVSNNARRLELYLAEHYTEPLSLAGLSRALNLSPSRLCALASSLGPGTTIGKIITSHRVNTARHLLQQTSRSVREIATMVGITDYNYFTKVFKKATGSTPTAFRESGGGRGAGGINDRSDANEPIY